MLEEKRVRGEMPGKTVHDAAAEAQRRRYQQTLGVPNSIPPPGAKQMTGGEVAQEARGEKEKVKGDRLDQMMAFMRGMDERMGGNFKGLSGKLDTTIAEVADLKSRVAVNERNIDGMRDMVRDVVREEMGTGGTGGPATGGDDGSTAGEVGALSQEKEDRYWKARRSLSFWPVTGSCMYTGLG